MRRSRTSWLRLRASGAAISALSLALLSAAGCVTQGTHQRVVEERDALQGQVAMLENRVRLLEASNESLSNERVKLIADVEDLGTEREKLAASVEELRVARDELEQNLASTSSQLAARNTEVQQLRDTYDGLVSDLQSEVASGRVQIEQLRDGLNVKLSQAVLFPSGSAELSTEGAEVLGKVAGRLRDLPHRVLVQGHTDDIPIKGTLAKRYPSNWELAGARAARVVRILAEGGVPGERLSAIALADTQPIASNDTPEGRAANRRIEIRMLPSPGAAPAESPREPTAAASPGE
jgi:chemotaxis protein MotB